MVTYTESMFPKSDGRLGKLRPYIQLGITGLVELFTGAVCEMVLRDVDSHPLVKFGARVGGQLIGFMIGGHVSDYVCDEAENMMDILEEVKDALDAAKEEAQ